MAKTFLDNNQRKFLDYFSKEKQLVTNFYFTGGTALSEYYLQHRRSVDLDFFCENEFSPQDVTPYVKKAKGVIGYKTVDFQQSFNRNMYHLQFTNSEILKLEFTYYPFPQIEKPRVIDGIRIDSLKDIAVNKVFTISQKPRGRDFFDLYFIIKKTGWSINGLIKAAKIKFDWHTDLLQFGANMLLVKEIKDDPLVGNNSVIDKVELFIIDEATRLGRKVID